MCHEFLARLLSSPTSEQAERASAGHLGQYRADVVDAPTASRMKIRREKNEENVKLS